MLLRVLLSPEYFALGLRDLRAHKLRSLLTALGVIFGVAAVICMLSIGEAASSEQLAQIRLLGSQNIILRSVEPPQSQEVSKAQDAVKKYGLTDADVARLRELPYVQELVLLRDVADTIVFGARRFDGHVLGTSENFFSAVHVRIARGRALCDLDSQQHEKVCVAGAAVARELFPQTDPLGQTVTVQSRSAGAVPYTIVGVLSETLTAGNPAKGLGARNMNRELFIPLGTADLRYGDLKVKQQGASREITNVHYHEIYVRVEAQEQVLPVSRLVERVMQHGRKEARERDFAITVPLELLQQAERVKRDSQIVLGSIAGISLLVGGIGIMNIMLASVTERTREIGIRRALGAKRHHITAQFLIQTLLLSVTGGLIGIGLGIGMAHLVTMYAEWQTIIPLWGVLLSFFVSALVGVVFGLYPASAAARLDPIQAMKDRKSVV